jgi:hypothetical protein
MSTPKEKAAAAASIAALEKQLADLKGEVAVESFADAIDAAQKEGFAASIAPAHNGGSPALRVDY